MILKFFPSQNGFRGFGLVRKLRKGGKAGTNIRVVLIGNRQVCWFKPDGHARRNIKRAQVQTNFTTSQYPA